ncbi:MAG TPA: hypothetical protein VGE93_02380 [Bryobacteraceae bacterium]
MRWLIDAYGFRSKPSNEESWAQSRVLPAGDVFRARLILALADGMSYREIELKLGRARRLCRSGNIALNRRARQICNGRTKEASRGQLNWLTDWIIDNNSNDDSREIVGAYPRRFHILLTTCWTISRDTRPLSRPEFGRQGEWIGIINDDEEAGAGWLQAIHDFSVNPFDFAGGPYQPSWAAEKTDWMSKSTSGIVGWVVSRGALQLGEQLFRVWSQ